MIGASADMQTGYTYHALRILHPQYFDFLHSRQSSEKHVFVMTRIQFDSKLAVPPVDRSRKAGAVYPRVAQIKGESDRKDFEDLYWGRPTLSSVSMLKKLEVGEHPTIRTDTASSFSIQIPIKELAAAASKVTSAMPTRAHLVPNDAPRKPQNLLSLDELSLTPPLSRSTPSSTAGSSECSEVVTPTEEYNRELPFLHSQTSL